MNDHAYMGIALRLAWRGYGRTSPNPMVGALLVRDGMIIGRGWHHRAGQPHAEIEALRDAERRGASPQGSTLYVTLEPCSTHGRTSPCTQAILTAGITRVVAAATDPNPAHAGAGFEILRQGKVTVSHGIRAEEAGRMNEAFNHWIVTRRPFVTLKAGMTLDGKIGTASGESRWITGAAARHHAMRYRRGCQAIAVGINTVVADDPALTLRTVTGKVSPHAQPRRVVFDSLARTPLHCRLVADAHAARTTILVTANAPKAQVDALAQRVQVVTAPTRESSIDLGWVLGFLGREDVTHLLVEGGGKVHGAFLERGLAQRVLFYYAPRVLGGANARKAVAGIGFPEISLAPRLMEVLWQRTGMDLLMTGRVTSP